MLPDATSGYQRDVREGLPELHITRSLHQSSGVHIILISSIEGQLRHLIVGAQADPIRGLQCKMLTPTFLYERKDCFDFGSRDCRANAGVLAESLMLRSTHTPSSRPRRTLVATINHERMAVLLTKEEEFETWLSGSADEAFALAREYPAAQMRIVQEGLKEDLLAA